MVAWNLPATTILASACIFLYFLTQRFIVYNFLPTSMIHQMLLNYIKWFDEMLVKLIKAKRQAEAKIAVVMADAILVQLLHRENAA